MSAVSISRVAAIFFKELNQVKRDRLTFGLMFGIPILQLLLFGFAINTDPKSLPTAVIAEEQTPIVRSLLQGMQNSGYFELVDALDDPRQTRSWFEQGRVSFVVSVPSGFTRRLVRGERPQLLVEADASDPAASTVALTLLETVLQRALQHELRGGLNYLAPQQPPFELVVHPLYNPERVTQYNIVPGLLGVILTMTLVMITSISMAREVERGTMENLLALPARAHEVMLGKIAPYITVGMVQTIVVLLAAHFIFNVPFAGSFIVLLLGIAVFMLANLALGFTFSTLANSQLQAMQLTFFFFLPSMLLTGFMFPYNGMPTWAQVLGEGLPLTHFLRVIRGVMLKDAQLANLAYPLAMMLVFTVVVAIVALLRYRRTLD